MVQFFLLSLVAVSVESVAVVSGKDRLLDSQVGSEQKTVLSTSDRSIVKPVLKANSCGEPIYPAESRRFNEEGKVGVQLWINESGNVVTAKVAVSSGFSALDEGAIAFLSRCKFEPATKNGVPTAVWFPINHRWTLADSEDEKPAPKGDYNFEDKSKASTFMIQLKETCGTYVSGFNNNETEDFEPLGVKKITEAEVCTCAEELIKADKYLKPFTAEKEPDVEAIMNVEKLQVYFARKTTAIMFECTGRAIDASISKFDPRKK